MAKVRVLPTKKDGPHVTEGQIVALFSRLELVMMALRTLDVDLARAGWPAKVVKTVGPLLKPVIADLDCGMSAADYERFARQVKGAQLELYKLAGDEAAPVEYCMKGVADELSRLSAAA